MLKTGYRTTFQVDKGTLFQSLEADTANVRPPSVSLLYLGQIALKLAYRVFREWRLWLITRVIIQVAW